MTSVVITVLILIGTINLAAAATCTLTCENEFNNVCLPFYCDQGEDGPGSCQYELVVGGTPLTASEWGKCERGCTPTPAMNIATCSKHDVINTTSTEQVCFFKDSTEAFGWCFMRFFFILWNSISAMFSPLIVLVAVVTALCRGQRPTFHPGMFGCLCPHWLIGLYFSLYFPLVQAIEGSLCVSDAAVTITLCFVIPYGMWSVMAVVAQSRVDGRPCEIPDCLRWRRRAPQGNLQVEMEDDIDVVMEAAVTPPGGGSAQPGPPAYTQVAHKE